MNMQLPTVKNFKLAHQLSRRIRIISPILAKDPERGYIFEILLHKREGIKKVRSVFSIGSVVIEFDPKLLPSINLLIMLDAILGNIAHTADRKPISHKKKITGKIQEVDLAVEGMTCASCALLIEMVLKRHELVSNANVNFATETLSVYTQLNKEEVQAEIAKLGYQCFPMDNLSQRKKLIEKEAVRLAEAKRKTIGSILLSLPVVATGMMMTHSRPLQWLQFALATPVVFSFGKQFFVKAWLLAKQRAANMDSLIALGVGSAYLYSLPALFTRRGHLYFEAAAAIISFVLLGRYMEENARGKAGEAIRKLVDLQPQTATLLRDGNEEIVAVEDISVGDVLLVRPGKKIPTDGEVIFGVSTVDEAMVTGESLPVVKEIGHMVIGGCVNGSGVLQIKATAVGMDTVLAGIVHMVDQAQASKLPIQKHVDKISAVFVPSVMALSALTMTGWLLTGAPLSLALGNAITVLLIACPCALGLATPAAIMVGTGQAANKGIYIRNGESLETAAKLNVIVFDKTGTITEGKPEVSDLFILPSTDEHEIIRLAASAENNSEHFLAKAIVEYAQQHELTLDQCSHFNSETGKGITAKIKHQQILIGNQNWFEEQQIDISEFIANADKFAEQGKTPVFMALNAKAVAIFAIADKPRPFAADAIRQLHKLGVHTLMVTGDMEKTAHYIASQVGIEQIVANAKPEQKLAIIKEFQDQGKQIGMIGDGINDAPALAAANVGFAIGSGTDIAIESADLTLVRGDISKVTSAISLSTETIKIIKQNLFWAFAYNTVSIPVAAFGKLNPMIASAAMALSSVSVVLNSLRLNNK